MFKSSITIKVISIFLALTFLTGQVNASEILSNTSGDKLALSSALDPDINPDRSERVQKDIAVKLNPGAIGAGQPLEELAKGNLPLRVTSFWTADYNEINAKLREAIDLALLLSMENQKQVPLSQKYRASQTTDNLFMLAIK